MSDLAPASAWDDDLVWPDGSLVDVESIEAWADEARMLASSVLEDGQVRTPDWCIAELAAVSTMAGRMTLVILNAESLRRRKAAALNRAKAEARIRHARLAPTLQTAHIVLEVAGLQDEYDVAIAANEYARRMGNLLSDYSSRLQTIGKQIELTYRGGA